jgi:phage terminase large subunit
MNYSAAHDIRAIDVVLGEKYLKLLWTPARHKAIYGGRGSAKSWSVATALSVIAGQEKKKIVCARQFQNSIRDSSKALIEKRLVQMGIRQQFHVTDQYIQHRGTKSEFTFVGLERNIESIRSLEGADIVWVEEARTIKAKSMEILLPTVRQPGSYFIWTWNPEQPTDPVDAYFRKFGPPPRSIVQFVDYTDNPFFYQTELPHEMEVLKTGNFERYKHVWLGAYDLASESRVFPNVTIGRVNVPGDCPPRYGMDFGFGGDPSFVVKVYIIEAHRILYIAAEASGHVAMNELPDMIRSVVHSDDDLIKADSSQPGTIGYLQGRGFVNMVGAAKGPGSVKSGINFINGYRIIVDPNCEAMREEARLYSYMTDKLTGKVLPGKIPVDAFNHGWDSTRYACEDAIANPPSDNDEMDGVVRLKW